jgi:aerobic-type carbon monoxide dehydrogenase small subunit (CoxS/CutS family)
MNLEFSLNGHPVTVDVPVTASLLDVVRDLGLTGTKEGCRVGVCGVCSVLVDGSPVSSCLYLAPCAAGRDVWTVEGLAASRPELARRFAELEAMQCGICTPGQVVMAAAASPDPALPEPERPGKPYLDGSLCRCTGYATILQALLGVPATEVDDARR